MNRNEMLLVLHITIAGVLLSSALNAMELDVEFSNDGVATTNLTGDADFITAIDVQADGKIVAGGFSGLFPDEKIGLVRYNRDGSLDPTFGNGGVVQHDLTWGNDELGSLSVQNDGSIMVGLLGQQPSSLNTRNIIARYTSDGALDSEFGTDGIAIVPSSDANFGELEVQADGSLLVCGHLSKGVEGNFAYVAKLTSSGVIDSSFAVDGIYQEDLTNDHDEFMEILVLPDASIVAAGTTYTNADPDNGISEDYKIAVAKISPQGELDTGFADDGVFIYDVDDLHFPTDVIALPNGNILVAATHFLQKISVLIMLQPSGVPDVTFGDNGSLQVQNTINDLLLLPSGRIMTTGQGPGGMAYFQVFKNSGSLERSFGHNGTHVFSSFSDSRGARVLQQDDGKIVMGGAVTPASMDYEFLTMRFNDPDPDVDGIMNSDNCPNDFNPEQSDSNGNGIGDVCDSSGGSTNNNSNNGGGGGGGGSGGGSADWFLIFLFVLVFHAKCVYLVNALTEESSSGLNKTNSK